MRRLALAIAASAFGHAAVLANAPFSPESGPLSLNPRSSALSARLESAPDSDPAIASLVAQSTVPSAAVASPDPGPDKPVPAAGLPAPEIYYRGKEVDERAEATNSVDVEYPAVALAVRMPGIVTLRLTIDHLGALRDVEVMEAQPAGVFEEAAIKAARALKFKPAVRNGVPVGSIKLIEVPFEPDCNQTGSCNN